MMIYKNMKYATLALILVQTFSFAGTLDYLESLSKTNTNTNTNMSTTTQTQAEEKLKKNFTSQESRKAIKLFQGNRIENDNKMSRVLLSFEKEKAMQTKLEKAIAEEKKRQEREAEEKRLLAQKKGATKSLQTPHSFPSLDEQLKAFRDGTTTEENSLEDGTGVQKKIKRKPLLFYGTVCKNNKCFLLGKHKLFKEGERVGGKKIVKITSDYVMFSNNKKQWFTR